MKICFVMYPWAKVKPEKDATLRLIHECCKRGHQVAYTTPENIIMNQGKAYADCFHFNVDEISDDIISFYHNMEFKDSWISLATFEVIFMRADPPLNQFMLDIIESVEDEVFIMNHVAGLRKGKTKVYTALNDDGSDDITPATYISQNVDHIMRIVQDDRYDKMIIKPLDGMGGKGVILVDSSMKNNLRALLDFYIKTSDDYVIVQNYIQGAEQGDARILILDGKPIGSIRRIPAEGEHRSNVSVGGSIAPHDMTDAEQRICDIIGPKLVKDGLYFVGIDVINGKLVEINVTSPGGITEHNRLYPQRNLQAEIIDFLEKKATLFHKDN